MPPMARRRVRVPPQLARMMAGRGRRRPPLIMGATRRPSPYVDNRKALLEEVIHPIYDTEGLPTTAAAATPAALQFFSRPVGQAATTGFVKTIRDTNLLTAGQLSRPKVQVVTGIRVVLSQVTGDTTSATNTLANFDFTDFVSTIRSLLSEFILTFDIGPKQYLKLPVNMLPGNVGLNLLGNSQIAPDAAAGTPEAGWTFSLFSRGDYFSVLPARLRIPSLQSFNAQIRPTRALVNGVTNVKVTVVLDGINGREVQ